MSLTRRFELEWHLPLEPGLPTYATLFDREAKHPHVVATAEGGDEAEAVLELWRTLRARDEPAEAVAFVADAYRKRTGQSPEHPIV